MITSPAGKTEFPFDDLDRLIDEEQALPAIPDFPSIYTTNEPIHRQCGPDGDHESL